MGQHADQSNHSGYSRSTGKTRKTPKWATAECYRCGGKGHYGRECQNAQNVICRDCGCRGHFARMCSAQVKNVNAIDDENDMQNVTKDYQRENSEEIFVLGRTPLSLSISGKNIYILVDSETSVNAIDQSLFQQLVYPQTIPEKLKAKIYPYLKTTLLELCGKVTLPV